MILVLIGMINPVNSQNIHNLSGDTIVVYETHFTYDTLFVCDTLFVSDTIRLSEQLVTILPPAVILADSLICVDSLLYKGFATMESLPEKKNSDRIPCPLIKFNPLSGSILVAASKYKTEELDNFFCELPATDFQENIIRVKTKKKLMESKEYRTINPRQLSWGISFGADGWWAKNMSNKLKSDLKFMPQVGVYGEKKLNRHLGVTLGLNYRWLASKGLHFNKDDNFLDFVQYSITQGIKESDIFNWSINAKDEDEFGFSQIDIPLKIGYTIGAFQTRIGVDFTRRFAENQDNSTNSFNILACLRVHLSDRLMLELNYCHALNGEMLRKAEQIGVVEGNVIVLPESKVVFTSYPAAEYISNNKGSLKVRRFGVSLSYRISKN